MKGRAVYNGRVYTNSWEAEEAERLDRWVKAGTATCWRPQVKVELTIGGKPVFTRTGRRMVYIVDFLVEFKDGTWEYREMKGRRSGPAFELWYLKAQILKGMGINVVLVGRDGQPVEE